MPAVINLNTIDDPRDAVHRAVQALAEGKLVALPTETVYGLAASALSESAVSRLLDIKQRAGGHPFALAVKSADDALDYVPDMSPLGRRLARRCWPGPVTLVLDDAHPDSVLGQLPPLVRQAVSPSGTVGLRVPAHSIVLSILRLSAGPLVLTSANRGGQPEAVTGSEVVSAVGGDIALVLDDGRCKFAQPSSVVRVRGREVEVLRSGVLNAAALKRLSSLFFLLVCTGNTCRSPMAERLLRRRIARKLGCPDETLEDHGVMVMSAGIAAMAGGGAALEAIEAMREQGIDLTNHETQPLTERLVRFADRILTMTRSHREAIVAQWPEAADRTMLLCRASGEIPDPIGGPPELYRACAREIEAKLEQWIDHLELDTVPLIKVPGT